MFDPTDKPRVFGTAPGVDFAQSLVDGLVEKGRKLRPDQWARAEIYVNTARMQRRIREVFDTGPARLLPRVRLITSLADDPVSANVPLPVSPLRRRLQLSQFVGKLLDQEPDLAPRAALYDLSDSLADLMDEMQGEGVSPEVFERLDIADQSGHWDRALKFLRIIAPFFANPDQPPDKEARQRQVITALRDRWSVTPPDHPIIVAGSTGSRGATALFMQAVAALPQGALILPGFDFDLPDDVWQSMDDPLTAGDHPQYRFRHLMQLIGFDRPDVTCWTKTAPHDPLRNKLVSLSLRPAPVTSQWLADGPDLGDLKPIADRLTILEAESPREEAETIALRVRQAAAAGQTAALISPDRMLTRQVTAALDRWNLTPDDSAGIPLALSPPGRLLRHVADMLAKPLTGEALLIILKHPLCNSGGADRGPHLLLTRELELYLRRHGPPNPTPATLAHWAGSDAQRLDWASWVSAFLTTPNANRVVPLSTHIDAHLDLAARLCAGPGGDGAGELWLEGAGREAYRICDLLRQEADAGGAISVRDYAALFGSVLAGGEVRDRDKGHPNILIWGTLEARVQGVDLTILGGMNDGVWPEQPKPDPWLNRKMRAEAGLLLPERRIGLSAHDYQQAISGREVWITRAKRSADAETVPSRWVNRLINLLDGLPKQHGDLALKEMRARGQEWAATAAKISQPDQRITPEPRPSPQPPVKDRPKAFSVTQIKTLIRDPFAIYARKVLRLDPLDPLLRSPDAPLRGIIIHGILEDFIKNRCDPTDRDAFMQLAARHMDRHCPWPAIRAQWLARLDRSADLFLAGEVTRQEVAVAQHTELSGKAALPDLDITLTCKADRIDVTADRSAIIYDYKTGAVPSAAQQQNFDKQLLLEAAMAERGAFETLNAIPVDAAVFIGVNSAMKNVPAPLDKQPTTQVWDELGTLFENWQRPDRGYTARLALFSRTDVSPYDHLSRHGEWDTSDDPVPQVLT
ncbi:double-strand break repair protein AddB [Yoonia sp. SS1-5]|uniref:Double-strand break repair protein AddB n=1 Tax=Yoonia rhodophyticola TaxID=3137370 RepID=A0AAN0MAV9_9RHOB